MDNPTLAALANLVPKQAQTARGALAPGKYEVHERVVLDVHATVDVGEDNNEYVPTVKIPLKATLALFFRYCGVTGPAALAALEKAMKEAHAIGQLSKKEQKTAEEAIEEMADLKAARKAVEKTLGAMPKGTRKGSVRVSGTVTSVDPVLPQTPPETLIPALTV